MSELAKPPTLGQVRAKRDEILRIAAAHGVTNVRVFGSVARGDADEQSDLDASKPPTKWTADSSKT